MSKLFMSLLSLSILSTTACNDYNPLDLTLEIYDREYAQQHAFTSQDVYRDSYKISTRIFHASNGSTKPPVVMLHGIPDNQHLYDRVAPLVQADRDVITFDFIGWGDSDKPDPEINPYDTASLLKDLETVIAAIVPNQKLVIVVHDVGGWPGIDWVLQNPEKVSALVILNSLYHASPNALLPTGLTFFVETPDNPNRDFMVQSALNNDDFWIHGDETTGFPGYRKQIGDFMADELVRTTYLPIFEALSFDMRPAMFGLAEVLVPEVTNRVASIPQMQDFQPPVRVVFGTGDLFLGTPLATEFATLFPNSTQVDVDNANHYVQIDQPQIVAEQILLADGL